MSHCAPRVQEFSSHSQPCMAMETQPQFNSRLSLRRLLAKVLEDHVFTCSRQKEEGPPPPRDLGSLLTLNSLTAGEVLGDWKSDYQVLWPILWSAAVNWAPKCRAQNGAPASAPSALAADQASVPSSCSSSAEKHQF